MLSSTHPSGRGAPCLDHEWAPVQLVKRKPPQSSRVWLGTSWALRATALQGGGLIRPPPPHPTCSQEITLPILSSPAGTGPNYTTDPLLSLFLLALHEFLHLLVGP